MSGLVRGEYNSTPPTLADHSTVPLQVDSKGALNVNAIVTATANVDVTYNATPPVLADTQTAVLQGATNGALIVAPQASYLSSEPTLTNAQVTALQVDPKGHLKGVPYLVYLSSPPTLTNAVQGQLLGDTGGRLITTNPSIDVTNAVTAMSWSPLATNTYSPSLSTSFGAATTATPKASSGCIYAIQVTNRNAAARYFQIYNTTAATTPVFMQWYVPPTGEIVIDDGFFVTGIYCSTGITWGMSTTAGSYIAATAGETDVMVVYK